ncbi:MAG: hypothetical protein FWC92_03010 [Defluviitaleaceae bacterium]|nr:hypothetical protein [Defluviitaleaceae bacterium]
MKRKLLLVLALLLLSLALVAACGNGNNDDDVEPTPPPVTEPTPEPPPAVPEAPVIIPVTDGDRGNHVNAVTTLVLNNRLERLTVDRATINNAAFNGERAGNFAENGNISWYVNIFFNGLYRVSMEYARYQGGNVGLRLDGGMNDYDFTAELGGTNGALQTVVLGYIPLLSMPDPYALTLSPTSFYNGEFAEFTSITLEWVENLDLYTIIDGDTRLLHHQASLVGEIIDEGDNLGFWCANSVASWPLSVRRPGNYRVRAYVTAPEYLGGLGMVSTVYDRVRTIVDIPGTGGWSNYVWVDFGVMTLREGNYYFRIQGYDLHGGHFMNLRYVYLVYVGSEIAYFPIRTDDATVAVATAVLGGQQQENYWTNVGHFRRNYEMTYNLEIFEGGSFEIILSYTSPYSGPGVLYVNDERSTFEVEATGGWGNYVELSLGVFDIAEGTVTIMFTGEEAPGDWFMNHDYIRIVRQ